MWPAGALGIWLALMAAWPSSHVACEVPSTRLIDQSNLKPTQTSSRFGGQVSGAYRSIGEGGDKESVDCIF